MRSAALCAKEEQRSRDQVRKSHKAESTRVEHFPELASNQSAKGKSCQQREFKEAHHPCPQRRIMGGRIGKICQQRRSDGRDADPFQSPAQKEHSDMGAKRSEEP